MFEKSNNLTTSFYQVRSVAASSASANAVLDTVAQFTKLCASDFNRINAIVSEIRDDTRAFRLSAYERALVLLQFETGLRVSELLRISFGSVNQFGYITVKASKGSADRIIISSDNLRFWLNVYNHKIMLSGLVDRFYYYRLLKRLGITLSLESLRNASVTHLFRYLVVYRMLSGNSSIEAVQRFLGHRSINSTLHYLNHISDESFK